MPRRRMVTTLATSPLVAMAERAVVAGATFAVLVYVNRDGDRVAISLPEMDNLQTAGLLSLAVADFAANAIEFPDEDEL